jgi:hypothetical protein
MRRFIKTWLMLAAGISKGVGWPPQKTYAAATFTTTSRYKLVNENSALILSIAPTSLTASSTVLSWSNNGTANHLWQFTSLSSGYDVIPQSLISLFL